jgi:single-strand DNA-binding protein
MNKTLLIGRIGRDPEMRTFPSGDKTASVSICTTEKWRDKTTGEIKENNDWHKLVFRGRLAEVVEQYVRKGSQLYVEGRLRTRKFAGQDGKDIYVTEVLVDEMEMLGSGNRQGGSDDQQHQQQPPRQNQQQPQQQRQQQPQQSSHPTDFGWDDGSLGEF